MGLVYKDRLSFRERFEEKALIKEGPIECKQCRVSFLFSGATGGGECPLCESPIDPSDLRKLGQKKISTLREDQDFEGGSLDETVKLKFALLSKAATFNSFGFKRFRPAGRFKPKVRSSFSPMRR